MPQELKAEVQESVEQRRRRVRETIEALTSVKMEDQAAEVLIDREREAAEREGLEGGGGLCFVDIDSLAAWVDSSGDNVLSNSAVLASLFRSSFVPS